MYVTHQWLTHACTCTRELHVSASMIYKKKHVQNCRPEYSMATSKLSYVQAALHTWNWSRLYNFWECTN